MACFDNIKKTHNDVSLLQKKILQEYLEKWKRNQQLSGNGAPFDNNLDKIQEWCEFLAQTIWNIRQQTERLKSIVRSLILSQNCDTLLNSLTQLSKDILDLLETLVRNTFIVEKQPPQVMKTNTRFSATVRFLVGSQLNVQMTPPQVKVSIHSESQANAFLRSNKEVITDASGEILNSVGLMEYQAATRQTSISFRNMQLKKIKRTEKKGTESVMDEKFALLFSSSLKIANGDIVFYIKILSLPVVVIVHGNQEAHAWATVTWDNAFAEPGRLPFNIPDKVLWPCVAEMLNMKFKASVGTDLTPEDLRFLAGKAFRNLSLQDYDNLLLSWAQFSKELLPERTFTFWEWFYAILKITRDHLKELFNVENRCIYGFIDRKQTKELLLSKPCGTFLIRYSDSEAGCVSIAYVSEVGSNPEILMIKPFSCKDLTIRSLADRINDLNHLTYLYPDIPKDQAFSKYYEPDNDYKPSPDGYVKPVLVTKVPNWASNRSTDSYPNTPQSALNENSPHDASNYYENPTSIRSESNGHSIENALHFSDEPMVCYYNYC